MRDKINNLDLRRKHESLGILGVIMMGVGLTFFIKKLPFGDVFNNILLIGFGFFFFLVGYNWRYKILNI